MAFHAKITGFAGGFAGVDVFFVISGYLIFGIILEALERDRFSFGQFYVRRINRIFPALILILVATSFIGWAVLYSNELELLGNHVAGGATFSSNFLLHGESGYFDSPNKPLLHLWSLAVEEQFYLLFPLVAFVAWKRKWDMRWTLIALIEISFVVNVWQVRHGEGDAAFYLPFARFWEILAGALLYHATMRTGTTVAARTRWPAARNAASAFGIGLLALTVMTASSSTPWPGLIGLAPVVGAALMIGAGKDAWLNKRILGHPWLVAIGLISYPLYLWHWPLLVLGSVVNEGELPVITRLAIVAASFLLAWATYRLFEIPIRFGKRKTRNAAFLLPALGLMGVIGVSIAVGLIPSRLDALAGRRKAAWGLDWEVPQDGFTSDRTGVIVHKLPGDSGNKVLLFGDSHAQQYWARFLEVEDDNRQMESLPEFDLVAFGGCPALPGINRVGTSWDNHPWQCPDFFRAGMAYAETPPVKTVVIANYWEEYFRGFAIVSVDDPSRKVLAVGDERTRRAFDGLEAEVRKLIGKGKRVYIVLSNPTVEGSVRTSRIPRRLRGLTGFSTSDGASTTIDRADFIASTRATSDMLRALAARTGAVIIDPAPFLCDSITCPRIAPDGIPIYKDLDHLRSGFVRTRVRYLDEVFDSR